MLLPFLLAASLAHAGVAVEDYGYSDEDGNFVMLDDAPLAEESLFWGWSWSESGYFEGLPDGGGFVWRVAGWDAYGYQQAVYARLDGGDIDGWGWSVAYEDAEESSPEIVTMGASCFELIPGVTALPVTIALTRDGYTQTLSLDRALLFDGGLSVDCPASSSTDGYLTLTFIGGAS